MSNQFLIIIDYHFIIRNWNIDLQTKTDILINRQQLCPLTEFNWYDDITIDLYTKTENPWYLTGIRDWQSYLNSRPQTSSSAPSDPPRTAVPCQIPWTRNPLIPSQRRWSGSPIPPRKAPSPTNKHSDSVILTYLYTVYQFFSICIHFPLCSREIKSREKFT